MGIGKQRQESGPGTSWRTHTTMRRMSNMHERDKMVKHIDDNGCGADGPTTSEWTSVSCPSCWAQCPMDNFAMSTTIENRDIPTNTPEDAQRMVAWNTALAAAVNAYWTHRIILSDAYVHRQDDGTHVQYRATVQERDDVAISVDVQVGTWLAGSVIQPVTVTDNDVAKWVIRQIVAQHERTNEQE